MAAWIRWLGETPGNSSARELRFIDAYQREHRLGDAEWNLLALYGRYGASFGF